MKRLEQQQHIQLLTTYGDCDQAIKWLGELKETLHKEYSLSDVDENAVRNLRGDRQNLDKTALVSATFEIVSIWEFSEHVRVWETTDSDGDASGESCHEREFDKRKEGKAGKCVEGVGRCYQEKRGTAESCWIVHGHSQTGSLKSKKWYNVESSDDGEGFWDWEESSGTTSCQWETQLDYTECGEKTAERWYWRAVEYRKNAFSTNQCWSFVSFVFRMSRKNIESQNNSRRPSNCHQANIWQDRRSCECTATNGVINRRRGRGWKQLIRKRRTGNRWTKRHAQIHSPAHSTESPSVVESSGRGGWGAVSSAAAGSPSSWNDGRNHASDSPVQERILPLNLL